MGFPLKFICNRVESIWLWILGGNKKVKLFNLGWTRFLSWIFTSKTIWSLWFLNFCYHSWKIMVEVCFRIKSEHGPHVQHCSWLIFLFPDLPLFQLPETSHLKSLSFFFFNLRLVDWVILRFPGTSFFVHLRLKTCIFKIFILFLAVLGLCCHMRSFSSCSRWRGMGWGGGLLSSAVHGILLVVTSLFMEHGL